MRRLVAAFMSAGQVIAAEKAVLGDLVVRLRHARLMPAADEEQGDVVVREDAEIGVKAEQLRLARQDDAGLLVEFAGERRLDRLAALDPAAGKAPARPDRYGG